MRGGVEAGSLARREVLAGGLRYTGDKQREGRDMRLDSDGYIASG